ncbi:DUF5615 family PIN-like protein [Rhizobium sp. 0TCS1.26]|uniref:DUF5615 family PIN-like protein n=1 Tax=Rhizobium sp. 0TCS1.26 TaxID=3142623 RepID=UPI003D2A2E6D
MRFLVDAQLPPALAEWLLDRGHQAEHVVDCNLQSASDRVIWEFAERVRAIIITKDEDFAQRRAVLDDGPTIIWIRLRNSRRRDILIWFDQVFPAILDALQRGETLIEIA